MFTSIAAAGAVCCRRRKVCAETSAKEVRGGTTRSAASAFRGRCRTSGLTEDRTRNPYRDNQTHRSSSAMRYCNSNVSSNVGRQLPTTRIGSFVATNKQIVKHSREGPQSMCNLLVQLSWEKRPLNAVNVATIFHSFSKTPPILTPDTIDYLIDSLQRVDDFDARAIGNACYGLQGLRDSPCVHRVLELLTSKLIDCTTNFSPQQCGNAIYGLQGLRDSKEIRNFVHAIEPKIAACREPFSSQAIACACLGMRHLGSSPEVRSMVAVLAGKVEQLIDLQEARDSAPIMASYQLDGQGIGNILNGLQCMENSPEVLRLILAISDHAERLPGSMKAQEIAAAFYGLRCLRGSPFEVRRLLAALCTQLQASTDDWMPRHIATTLYGLRWVGESDESRRILLVVAEKIKYCSRIFDGHAVGNSLYGLQAFACCPEVQSLLDALAPKVASCYTILTGQEIGNAFYGFRSLGDCNEVRQMLAILTTRLEQCDYLDPQAISNALYGLHAFGNIPEVMFPIINMLSFRIQQCRDHFKAQAIANSFFALKNMDQSSTALGIIASLTQKMNVCSEPFTAAQIGNMLYNSRLLGNACEVQNFLRILKMKIQDCRTCFQEDDIVHAFLGLCGLGEYAEVRDILQVLTPHVESCQTLNAHEVSICLSAFRVLHRIDEVRPLLKVLVSKVKNCEDKICENHHRKALQGLRQFGASEDVRLLFRTLAEKAQQDGVSVAGTLLQRFIRHPKSPASDS